MILLQRSFDLDTKENLEMDIIPRHGRTQAGTGQRNYVSLKERVIVLRVFFESSRKKRNKKDPDEVDIIPRLFKYTMQEYRERKRRLNF